MFQRGVSYSAEAYELAPQSITWGRWLSIGLKNVAIKQALFGEQDNALQSYQRYVAVCRKLAFENPAVPSLKGELHQAFTDLASYQRELKLTVELTVDQGREGSVGEHRSNDARRNVRSGNRLWRTVTPDGRFSRIVGKRIKPNVNGMLIWRWRRSPRQSKMASVTSTR